MADENVPGTDQNDEANAPEEESSGSDDAQQVLDDLTVLSDADAPDTGAEQQPGLGDLDDDDQEDMASFTTIHQGSSRTTEEIVAALPDEEGVTRTESSIQTDQIEDRPD